MNKLTMTRKQNEYIRNANARWNFKIGAVRSGKSFVDISCTIPTRIRERIGLSGLAVIMGVSKGTLERNVLQPMREIYTSELVSTINNENIAHIFGEEVYCLGAEKKSQVSKILGSSIKYCYGDEVAKWNKDVFDVLKSRLDKPYSCFDGACNPESPNHWLKEFIDDPELDAYIQKYQIFDNKFLPKEYVDNLCKEYAGTVYYDRYIIGEWALAEGLIYPMYKDAIVDSIPDMPISDYIVSIDYGTMNAFAGILWCKRGNIWYAEKEYYYSGRDTGTQKTDQEYAEDLQKWIDDVWKEKCEHPTYSALSGMTVGKIDTIIDPSAASFIALLKKSEWARVRSAKNDVLDGIRHTAVALQTGKVKILRGAMPNLIKEIGGYRWDDTIDEHPIKENDHCLTGDTLVMTEYGAKPIEELVGTTGKVWSYNTFTDEKELRQYKDCRLTQKQVPVWELKTASGKTIKGTIDHLILTKSGWLELGRCMFEYIQMIDGSVEEVVYIHAVGYADVYNMEVEDNHNFAVNDGLIVHNCMDAMRYFIETKQIAKARRM